MLLNPGAAIALDAFPAGKEGFITRLSGDAEGLVRAQAMGLRAGKPVQVLRRNGRLLLVRVGATCLAISADLARRVEVQ
jgi:Fe2+ transport system protein FeoA